MSLDFRKVVSQVRNMGQAIANHNLSLADRVQIALEYYENLPSNDVIHERVSLARIRDVGYRGIAPMEGQHAEAVNTRYDCPDLPDTGTIIAADGSQIYPDQHAAAFYYLTNVGIFTYFHGEDRLPLEYTQPTLVYKPEETHDRAGNPIKNAAVNAQRSLQEMELLAKHAWEYRDDHRPTVAMYDGPLLYWLGKDVPNSEKLEQSYHRALAQLRDTHNTQKKRAGSFTSLIGHVDRPTSRFFIAMLRLMELDESEVRRKALETLGQFEGLTDRWLFQEILEPGQRSALMVQQSPQNKLYRQEVGDDFEIVFFYVNVSQNDRPYLARVEMPMWVARNSDYVEHVHAMVVSQCDIMGNYPYALTRADELAVVRSSEKGALEDIIRTELIRHVQPFDESSKLIGKHQTRSERKAFGDQY